MLTNPQPRLRCRQSDTPRSQKPGCVPGRVRCAHEMAQVPVRWDQKKLQCSSHNFTKCQSRYLTSLTMPAVGVRLGWSSSSAYACLGEAIRLAVRTVGSQVIRVVTIEYFSSLIVKYHPWSPSDLVLLRARQQSECLPRDLRSHCATACPVNATPKESSHLNDQDPIFSLASSLAE